MYLETKVEPTHARIKSLKITEKCTHAQSREQGLQPLLTDVPWEVARVHQFIIIVMSPVFLLYCYFFLKTQKKSRV